MKLFHHLVVCLILSSLAGCSTYYMVLKDTPPPRAFKNYSSIFVGWIDLDDSRWKRYGYQSIGQWQGAIGGANLMSLPQYFREFMPDKKITMASSAGDIDPRDADLYIRFSNVNYITGEDSGARGGAVVVIGPDGARVGPAVYVDEQDVMTATIDFIDVKEDACVYSATVIVSTGSASGYYGWTLEARINSAFYNTVAFIDRTLKGKKK